MNYAANSRIEHSKKQPDTHPALADDAAAIQMDKVLIGRIAGHIPSYYPSCLVEGQKLPTTAFSHGDFVEDLYLLVAGFARWQYVKI